MRHGPLIGLLILALALGLGVVAVVMMYADGQQQQELLIRIGIPGALLLCLAIGALIVCGGIPFKADHRSLTPLHGRRSKGPFWAP